MIWSVINLVKLVRNATYPQLGLVESKTVIDRFLLDKQSSGIEIETAEEILFIVNICLAINSGVIVVKGNEITWAKSEVTDVDLERIARNPQKYIDGRK